MKHTLISCAIALSLLASCGIPPVGKPYNEGINIIPVPLQLERLEGEFLLTPQTVLATSDPEARATVNFFAERIRRATGYELTVSETAGSKSVSLSIDETADMDYEGYELEVTPASVNLKAKTNAGLFYGMQTFMQLLPAEIESPNVITDVSWAVPAVKIKDEPRFAHRGVMLDPCRHFIPVENVKKQLDVFALFKINRMHFHLTDDQGWRIEIKQYPRLTEVGSKSSNSEGFYTQEEIKDIVNYAAERHITVIPEIEIPGHELAAIAAYPELSCTGQPTTPRLVWGVEDVVLCAGKESVFEFFENVIKEVVPLFPSEYFHIGGDECPKKSWQTCPLCQQRIRELGLHAHDGHTTEELLQSWFVQRMEKALAAYDKRIIGWDEILEGGLAPSATVMSWRGEKGGIAAACLDHDVIMTPGGNTGMYIDQFEGDYKIDPVSIGGYNPLSNVYKYDPIPDTLISINMSHHIKGVQANLWGEYLYTTDILEYRGYPRILALSEIAWSATGRKNFPDFERRLNNALVRLDGHSINYFIPQPEQPGGSCNFVAFIDSASLDFTVARPDIKIIYTTDGTDPTAHSTVYDAPLRFTESATLKIRSLLLSGKMSPVRAITVEKQIPSPAVTLPASAQAGGLKLKITHGTFMSSSELSPTATWTEGLMRTWRDLVRTEPYSNSMRNYNQFASIATGYIDIPDDGVYYFSSDNEEVWIDNNLLIDNKGEVKRFSRHDKSIALAKGYHEIKVLFLGHIIGGWPSNWNSGVVSMRKSDATRFVAVNPDNLRF